MGEAVFRDDARRWGDDEPAPSIPESGVVPVAARPALTCVLLGEEPLAARCGDVLLERGHSILGLVTSSAALRQWARARNIPVLERRGYRSWLQQRAYDVLLSITHPNLIQP